MNQFFKASIGVILFVSNVHASPVTSIALDVGHRSDDVNFNIAGNMAGNSPNILSELKWSNLKIFQKKLSIEHYRNKGPILMASFSYGAISSGSNQDSDYNGDNRTLEFSRSINNVAGDDIVDLEIGFGYQFDIHGSTFENLTRIVPLLGFSRHEQNLRITNGFQVIPFAGAFPGLNTTYKTEWDGLWAGAQLWFKSMNTGDKFYLSFKRHWPDYSAEANWNLRTDLAHPVSFEHFADGEGNEFSFGWLEDTNTTWAMRVGLSFQKWQTNPGLDMVYFSDSSIGATRLNTAEWKSAVFMFGLTYQL